MRSLLFVLFLLTSLSIFAQDKSRMLCVLDMQERNVESNDARSFSCLHMANVAGVPSIFTAEFTEAIQYGAILFSSELKSNSFSSEELSLLTDYVSNGGVIIASRIDDEAYFSLFGIENIIDSKNRYSLNFDVEEEEALFDLINEEHELTISLGRSNGQDIFKTIAYETTSAEILGNYDDDSPGFIRNIYGEGAAYAFGFAWKETILRNQINRDYEAQRITSNGFEATQDVLFFLVRNIFSKHISHSVWKHSSPRNSSSTLLVTHDLDSRTGMDSMSIFALDEKERGIVATYNITTRYFDDDLMNPFYNGNEDAVDYIMGYGHAIGSHSVGHFFDFADNDLFPLGEPGNTRDNYSPFNDGSETMGGTVYGECEVSKNILIENHSADIRCFRAGHLAFNKYLINVLDSLGYEFDSNFSSADILTNFPFQSKYGRSFSGQTSNITEIPVTISDVFHSDPITADNYQEKVAIWKKVFDQNDANGAVTTLLVHPNRIWKNTAQNMLFDQLPNAVNIMEMGAYGDYWNKRKGFTFSSALADDQLLVQLDQVYTEDLEDLSIIVKDGQELETIKVLDYMGNVLAFDQEHWKENDVIVFIPAPVVSSSANIRLSNNELIVYPNPAENILYFELDEINNGMDIEVSIIDVQGKIIRNLGGNDHYQQGTNSVSLEGLFPGIYLLKVKIQGLNQLVRFVKVQ